MAVLALTTHTLSGLHSELPLRRLSLSKYGGRVGFIKKETCNISKRGYMTAGGWRN